MAITPGEVVSQRYVAALQGTLAGGPITLYPAGTVSRRWTRQCRQVPR